MPTRGSLFSLSVKRPMSENRLLRHHEVAAAVRLPALLVVLGAEGLFLAVADGVQAVGGNAQRNEILLDRIRGGPQARGCTPSSRARRSGLQSSPSPADSCARSRRSCRALPAHPREYPPCRSRSKRPSLHGRKCSRAIPWAAEAVAEAALPPLRARWHPRSLRGRSR